MVDDQVELKGRVLTWKALTSSNSRAGTNRPGAGPGSFDNHSASLAAGHKSAAHRHRRRDRHNAARGRGNNVAAAAGEPLLARHRTAPRHSPILRCGRPPGLPGWRGPVSGKGGPGTLQPVPAARHCGGFRRLLMPVGNGGQAVGRHAGHRHQGGYRRLCKFDRGRCGRERGRRRRDNRDHPGRSRRLDLGLCQHGPGAGVDTDIGDIGCAGAGIDKAHQAAVMGQRRLVQDMGIGAEGAGIARFLQGREIGGLGLEGVIAGFAMFAAAADKESLEGRVRCLQLGPEGVDETVIGAGFMAL